MHRSKFPYGAAIAGLGAGLVNGIFGGAGGMVLIPGLSLLTEIDSDALFPMSVRVMLPVCLFTLFISSMTAPLPWADALPYLVGSVLGGLAVGKWGAGIPALWLHRIFGILILWGGIRYLC